MRDRPEAVVQARAARRRPSHRRSAGRCSSTGPPRREPGPTPSTCRATPTCSGPSRCCSPITCWLMRGPSHATSIGCSPPSSDSTSRRSAPGRSPARRCRSTPPMSAAELGFARVFENSLDAVVRPRPRGRGALRPHPRRVHLSRIGEEWVLWTSEEFGFARLDDGYATGSSMLPQKKNPDIAELARGKAGRIIGNLTGLLGDPEGLAARLQPRPPGGQGTAVRHRRPDPPGARRHRRDDRHGDVRPRADAGGRRLRDGVGDRPRRMARRPGHARSGTPTPSSGRSFAGAWPARAPSRPWSPPTPSSGPRPPRWSPRGVSVTRRTTPGGAGPGPGRGAARTVRRRAGRAQESGGGRAVASGPWVIRHRFRVRYVDCDAQRVMHNAHYLAYVDDAVDSWFREALGRLRGDRRVRRDGEASVDRVAHTGARR